MRFGAGAQDVSLCWPSQPAALTSQSQERVRFAQPGPASGRVRAPPEARCGRASMGIIDRDWVDWFDSGCLSSPFSLMQSNAALDGFTIKSGEKTWIEYQHTLVRGLPGEQLGWSPWGSLWRRHLWRVGCFGEGRGQRANIQAAAIVQR